MNDKPIPSNTIRRLPKYYHYMNDLLALGETFVTSDQIAQHFGVHPTQVRKDLAFTGLTGKPKVGHVLADAVQAIQQFLGWNNTMYAFLVGVGNLGKALMGYNGFDITGVKIVAAFDNDPQKIGTSINGIEVFPIQKFTNLAQRMHVKIGILTCSPESAQDVANTMVVVGIKAIWNFTPVKLYIPDGVVSEQTELYSSLAILSRKLEELG